MTTDIDLVPLEPTKLRRRLRRAWQPFFGRFGNLTEVQACAIPIILAGQNLVVSAPTASGKTEAVAAPVAELQAREQWPGLAVLYIVPTRALGNDLITRLEGPLSEMYLKAVLRHGERPNLPASPIDWLITTPESLDSLLCRQPSLFAALRVVILDEIHLLDGTYRGDQLRVLLARIAHLIGRPPSVHLLSATLPDPGAIAQRYVQQFKIITVGKPRALRVHLLRTHEDVLHLAQQEGWRKVLYFCNTRQNVEETAREVQVLWKPYPVVAHHASLERNLRQEAEEVMKQNQVAVCVATSTLEIGIDIGDIDLIVLADPPWSLESLQQRVGRGKRRADIVEAAAIYHSEEERLLLELMFEAAAAGADRPRDYRPDRSVMVQQVLSLLYQHRQGMARQDMRCLLGVLGTDHEIAAILNHLEEVGYVLELGDSLYPSSQLLDLGDEGKIHSNIPDRTDYVVRDADSGRTVGRIRGSFDNVFLLAGRSWKVLVVHGDEILARRHSHAASAPTFGMQRNVGQFYHLLPPELRQTE